MRARFIGAVVAAAVSAGLLCGCGTSCGHHHTAATASTPPAQPPSATASATTTSPTPTATTSPPGRSATGKAAPFPAPVGATQDATPLVNGKVTLREYKLADSKAAYDDLRRRLPSQGYSLANTLWEPDIGTGEIDGSSADYDLKLVILGGELTVSLTHR